MSSILGKDKKKQPYCFQMAEQAANDMAKRIQTLLAVDSTEHGACPPTNESFDKAPK
jgi:coenzyme F420-reducing hydrogenase gamma subunit